MYRTKPVIGTIILMLSVAVTGYGFAQAPEEKQEPDAREPPGVQKPEAQEQRKAPAPAMYLPIKPAFVVNYGGAGRLRYLKTELSVRLENSDAANSIRHHLPYIRNNLVMLFARQTDESISSQEGKETLRRDVLAEIRKVIKEEDGREGVVDVYFDTFIIQK